MCVNEREQVRESMCVCERERKRKREGVEQKTEGARHRAVLHQCSSMCSLTIECVLLL